MFLCGIRFPSQNGKPLGDRDHAVPWVLNLHRPYYHDLCIGGPQFISVVWIEVWANRILTSPLSSSSSLFLACSLPQDAYLWEALMDSSLICWQGLEVTRPAEGILQDCLYSKRRLLEDRKFKSHNGEEAERKTWGTERKESLISEVSFVSWISLATKWGQEHMTIKIVE